MNRLSRIAFSSIAAAVVATGAVVGAGPASAAPFAYLECTGSNVLISASPAAAAPNSASIPVTCNYYNLYRYVIASVSVAQYSFQAGQYVAAGRPFTVVGRSGTGSFSFTVPGAPAQTSEPTERAFVPDVFYQITMNNLARRGQVVSSYLYCTPAYCDNDDG